MTGFQCSLGRLHAVSVSWLPRAAEIQTYTTMDRDSIWRAIESWPLEDQPTLAHAILQRSQVPLLAAC
jgi:hypothetical protein